MKLVAFEDYRKLDLTARPEQRLQAMWEVLCASGQTIIHPSEETPFKRKLTAVSSKLRQSRKTGRLKQARSEPASSKSKPVETF